ncbi:hypothetical protein [Tortoise microvirus 93]|nr:hypothetical protein [Tortoise microvirus 93]
MPANEPRTIAGRYSLRTPYNFVLGQQPYDYEEVYGPSETVPDQTLSLQEILYRHSRGLPIPSLSGTYSDEDLPDLRTLDLSEIQEIKERNIDRIAQLRDEIQQAELVQRLKREEQKRKSLQDALKAESGLTPDQTLNPQT